VTRLSGDELRDGYVWNGFDYALQVWVIDGVAQSCGHPVAMPRGGACCPALRLAGRRIETIPGAQHLTLAGQTHNVKPAVLAPAVRTANNSSEHLF
jgi:hypothetical protein